MTTALISHHDCLLHVTPPGHPERLERLQAINAALEAEVRRAAELEAAGHPPQVVSEAGAGAPEAATRTPPALLLR